MAGRTCDFCGGVATALDGELGPLMGPLYRDKEQTRAVWFHRQCALYSPRCYLSDAGYIVGAVSEVKRGRGLACCVCKRSGATLGCRVPSCPATFHLPCALLAAAHLSHKDLLLTCPGHAGALYKEEGPGLMLKAYQAGLTPAIPARGALAAAAGRAWAAGVPVGHLLAAAEAAAATAARGGRGGAPAAGGGGGRAADQQQQGVQIPLPWGQPTAAAGGASRKRPRSSHDAQEEEEEEGDRGARERRRQRQLGRSVKRAGSGGGGRRGLCKADVAVHVAAAKAALQRAADSIFARAGESEAEEEAAIMAAKEAARLAKDVARLAPVLLLLPPPPRAGGTLDAAQRMNGGQEGGRGAAPAAAARAGVTGASAGGVETDGAAAAAVGVKPGTQLEWQQAPGAAAQGALTAAAAGGSSSSSRGAAPYQEAGAVLLAPGSAPTAPAAAGSDGGGAAAAAAGGGSGGASAEGGSGGSDSGRSGSTPPSGFASLGGLADVKQQLWEMVLLPLLQPQLVEALAIDVPRGLLLHGPPGVGKTAVVRALAAEVAVRSPARVALFARKGSDCLGKYAGDAERNLRLLFQMAAEAAPSIIFLDELDALVPARRGVSSTSDQIHASVVSVLLALMDGVAGRGAVAVVGATNRPDSIDPALRRPGRFDREVHVPLPDAAARAEILHVLTQHWSPRPPASLLAELAGATAGMAGADLAALASGALLAATRRAAPHLLQQLEAAAAASGGPTAAAAAAAAPAPAGIAGLGTPPAAREEATPGGHPQPSPQQEQQQQHGAEGRANSGSSPPVMQANHGQQQQQQDVTGDIAPAPSSTPDQSTPQAAAATAVGDGAAAAAAGGGGGSWLDVGSPGSPNFLTSLSRYVSHQSRVTLVTAGDTPGGRRGAAGGVSSRGAAGEGLHQAQGTEPLQQEQQQERQQQQQEQQQQQDVVVGQDSEQQDVPMEEVEEEEVGHTGHQSHPGDQEEGGLEGAQAAAACPQQQQQQDVVCAPAAATAGAAVGPAHPLQRTPGTPLPCATTTTTTSSSSSSYSRMRQVVAAALSGLTVLPCDWWSALGSSSPPSSCREAGGALSATAGASLLSPAEVTLVTPALCTALVWLEQQGVFQDLPTEPAAAAAAAAGEGVEPPAASCGGGGRVMVLQAASHLAASSTAAAAAAAAAAAGHGEQQQDQPPGMLFTPSAGGGVEASPAWQQLEQCLVQVGLVNPHVPPRTARGQHPAAVTLTTPGEPTPAAAKAMTAVRGHPHHASGQILQLELTGGVDCGQQEVLGALGQLLGAWGCHLVNVDLPALLLRGEGDLRAGLLAAVRSAAVQCKGRRRPLVLLLPDFDVLSTAATAPGVTRMTPTRPTRLQGGATTAAAAGAAGAAAAAAAASATKGAPSRAPAAAAGSSGRGGQGRGRPDPTGAPASGPRHTCSSSSSRGGGDGGLAGLLKAALTPLAASLRQPLQLITSSTYSSSSSRGRGGSVAPAALPARGGRGGTAGGGGGTAGGAAAAAPQCALAAQVLVVDLPQLAATWGCSSSSGSSGSSTCRSSREGPGVSVLGAHSSTGGSSCTDNSSTGRGGTCGAGWQYALQEAARQVAWHGAQQLAQIAAAEAAAAAAADVASALPPPDFSPTPAAAGAVVAAPSSSLHMSTPVAATTTSLRPQQPLVTEGHPHTPVTPAGCHPGADAPLAPAAVAWAGLNAAQQETATQLLLNVRGLVQSMGTALKDDRQSGTAQINPLVVRKIRAGGGSVAGALLPPRPATAAVAAAAAAAAARKHGRMTPGLVGCHGTTLYHLGNWAAQGGCWDFDQLLTEARKLTEAVRASFQDAWVGSTEVAAAAALEDWLECVCAESVRSLGLQDPERRRLLGLAVAYQQEQLTQGPWHQPGQDQQQQQQGYMLVTPQQGGWGRQGMGHYHQPPQQQQQQQQGTRGVAAAKEGPSAAALAPGAAAAVAANHATVAAVPQGVAGQAEAGQALTSTEEAHLEPQQQVLAERLYLQLLPGISRLLQQNWQYTTAAAAAAAAAAGGGGASGEGAEARAAAAAASGAGSLSKRRGGSHLSDLARLRRLLRQGATAAVWAGAWQQYAAAGAGGGEAAGAASVLSWAAESAAGGSCSTCPEDTDVGVGAPAAAAAATLGLQPAAREGGEHVMVQGAGVELAQLSVGRLRAVLEGQRA